MTHQYHAVVWMDHHEARVFHFDHAGVQKMLLHPDHPTRHIHHKTNSIGSGHAPEDHDFLRDVTAAIQDAQAILITGPANAKTELVKYINRAEPLLIELIAAIESVDHPSDKALVAHARAYFRTDHQTLPRSR